MAALVVVVALLAGLEILARGVLFPEWRALSPRVIGENPYFGLFTLPNLSVRRYSPGNYDAVNHTNSFGLRGPEAGFAESLNGIWVAGDSNTFGLGLDDDQLYTARLAGKGFPVANLANEGGGVESQLPVMRTLARMGFRPKVVIFAMTLNESIRDYPPLDRPTAAPPPAQARAVLARSLERLARPELLTKLGIKTTLLRNCAFYGWAKLNATRVSWLQSWLTGLGVVQDVDLVPRGTIEVMRVAPNAADPLFDRTADAFGQVRDFVEGQLGARFLVLLLPSHHTLYPARFDKFAAHFGLDRGQYAPERPVQRIAQSLAARNVAWVDATPALRAVGDPQLIFANDAHFNAKGHAILADLLVRSLAERGGR